MVAAAARVLADYGARIERWAGDEEAIVLVMRGEGVERAMRLVGLQAERADFFKEFRAHRLDSETARKLIRELDLLEAQYVG